MSKPARAPRSPRRGGGDWREARGSRRETARRRHGQHGTVRQSAAHQFMKGSMFFRNTLRPLGLLPLVYLVGGARAQGRRLERRAQVGAGWSGCTPRARRAQGTACLWPPSAHTAAPLFCAAPAHTRPHSPCTSSKWRPRPPTLPARPLPLLPACHKRTSSGWCPLPARRRRTGS